MHEHWLQSLSLFLLHVYLLGMLIFVLETRNVRVLLRLAHRSMQGGYYSFERISISYTYANDLPFVWMCGIAHVVLVAAMCKSHEREQFENVFA